MKIKIYCLKDPYSNEIRYVGMTSKTLKQRLRKHLDNALYTKHNKHLCNWILKFYKDNKLPTIELIEECEFEKWQNTEKYWISKFPNLLNYTNGGEGSFGFKHSYETKEKIRQIKLGNKQSDETRRKRSMSLKGRIITKEHREKIGLSNSNKIYAKYNIKITDNTTGEILIKKSIKETLLFLNVSRSTLCRHFNSGKSIRNRYIIEKIDKQIL